MVDNAIEIDMETFDWGIVPENIDDLYVYEKIPILGENLGNDSYYYVPHLWGDVKETYLENLQAPKADEDEVIKDVTDIEEGKDLENPEPEPPEPEKPDSETPDSEKPDSETPEPENPELETTPVLTTLSVRISSSQGRWIKTVNEDGNPADQDAGVQDSTDPDPDADDQKPVDQDSVDQEPADQDPTTPDLVENEDSKADSDVVLADEYSGGSSYKLYIVTFKRIEGPHDKISRYAVRNPETIRESLNGYGAYDFVKVEVSEEPDDVKEPEVSEKPDDTKYPEDPDEPEKPKDEYVQAYTFIGKDIYCRNTFKSNEWFKKYVLNMEECDYEKFSIRVITLTPDELNKMETLPEFDFLYLNSGLKNVSIDNNKDEGSVTDYKPYAVDNDLSPESLQYLVSRTVAGALPCLVDGAILYEKEENGAIVIKEALKETQIFRLAAIMCQDSLEEWYKENSNDLIGVNVDKLLQGIVDDADKNFVTEQVYCRFDDVSIIT